MAFLNKGLRIAITDLRKVELPAAEESEDDFEDDEAAVLTSRNDVFLYERGIEDYVQHLNNAKRADLVHEEIISF